MDERLVDQTMALLSLPDVTPPAARLVYAILVMHADPAGVIVGCHGEPVNPCDLCFLTKMEARDFAIALNQLWCLGALHLERMPGGDIIGILPALAGGEKIGTGAYGNAIHAVGTYGRA